MIYNYNDQLLKKNLFLSLGFFFNILNSIKITLATSNVTTITLNTDTLAIRPVHAHVDDDGGVELATRLIHPIVDEEKSDGVELVHNELSIVIITITGDDLSLSYSILLIVKTPYT